MNKSVEIVNHDAARILEDGVYVDLPEADYFAQDALGSSDIRKLIADPVRWWWQSKHNPFKELSDKKSPEMIIGSAWHCLALEGREAFESRYMKAPDKSEYDALLITTSDIRGRIADLGHKPEGKLKEDLIAQLARIDDGAQIWDRILAAAETDPRQCLTASDYEEIVLAAGALLENPDFQIMRKDAFAELSVFWTEGEGDDAVRRRARFDVIGPRGIADLKSIGIIGGDPRLAVMRAIDNNRYDIQAADHKRAMLAAFDFLDGQPKEVRRALSCQPNYSWYFWDKRAGPSIHSVDALIGGLVWDSVDMEITRALDDCRRFRSIFGMNNVWREHRDPNRYEPGASWGMRGFEEAA